jgi:hypothetical protein
MPPLSAVGIPVLQGGEDVNLTPHGEASPLEMSIFKQCANLGAVFQFGRSMIFNHGDV